ncbi:MAG: hypothetical protein AAGE52_06920 [Myxococcota bacterium]
MRCWLFVLAACTSAPSLELQESDYEQALRAQERALVGLQRRAEAQSTSPTAWTNLAEGYRSHAALTGSLRGYVDALSAVERASAISPELAAGSRAALLFSVHRLEDAASQIEIALARPLLPEGERAELLGLRGEIRLHQGNLIAARADLDEAFALRGTMANAFRLALWHWHRGEFEDAEGWVDAAEAALPRRIPRAFSWLDLQRGLLDWDRGRAFEALAHYDDAEAHFSGDWLVAEHRAEALALLGEHARAEAIYREVVVRTGDPALTDALASLLEAQGRDQEARALVRDAQAGFDADLALLPSAAGGHAIDFALRHHSPDAISLAAADYAFRPGGAQAVKFAQAELQRGRTAAARELLRAAEETSYRHAELWETAAYVADAEGRTDDANSHRAHARRINPHVDLSHLP